jgi:hypothetical protein
MNRGSTSVEQARSLIAPGNPVPCAAFGDSWRDPLGQATYQRIVAHPPSGPAPRLRRPIRRLRPVAAVAAAAGVVAASLLIVAARTPAPGEMATAPMLHYILTGVSQPTKSSQLPSARSLLLHLARIAGRQPAVPQAPGANVGYVLTNEWYMRVAVAGGTSTSVVVPEVDRTWTAPRGTDRQVRRFGKPLVGAVGSQQTLRAAESGPPVSDSVFRTAEQFGPLVRDLSANPARLATQLLDAPPYAGSGWPTAYHLVRIISDLHHQVVAPRLEAALWRVLAAEPAVRYLGTVVDRAGRTGDAVAVSLVGQGSERQVLIISPATGRLLGQEQIFRTNPGLLNIRVFPAVVSYVTYLSEGWTTNLTVPAP